jgi:hypothetical protein
VIDVSVVPECSYAVCGLQVDTDFSEEHAIFGAGISSLLIPSERKNSFQILHLFFFYHEWHFFNVQCNPC